MGDAVVGIIGMGDMGKMYARRISDAGWKYVEHLCFASRGNHGMFCFYMTLFPFLH